MFEVLCDGDDWNSSVALCCEEKDGTHWAGNVLECSLAFIEHYVDGTVRWLLLGSVVVATLHFACWLLWHFDRILRYRIFERLGIEIVSHYWLQAVIILNIYYRNNAFWHETPGPFVACVYFVCTDSALMWLGQETAREETRKKTQQQKENGTFMDLCSEEFLTLDTDDVDGKAPVKNRYQKITEPFVSTLYLFLVQCVLMTNFILYMNKDNETKDVGRANLAKWLSAVFVVPACLSNKCGGSYDHKQWQYMFNYAKRVGVFDESNGGIEFKIRWRLRMMFDAIINLWGRYLIQSTVAIIATKATPQNFMKDLLCFFFIAKLDDISGTVTIKSEIEELFKLMEKEDGSLMSRFFSRPPWSRQRVVPQSIDPVDTQPLVFDN